MVEPQVLECKELRTYYRAPLGEVKAVDGVSLQVGKGKVMGICGESGCGKTTLALSVVRCLRPRAYIKEGEVLLEGKNILAFSEEEFREIRWKQIAYIPQSAMNSLNPVLRVEDHFLETFQAHGFDNLDEARRNVSELLSKVGLPRSVARMYPHELSGGMKQRVVIALAIAFTPSILIADEPTTALDVVVQKGILQVLQKIITDYGMSIMLITHDVAVNAEIVDQIAVMYAGKIVEMGEVYEVFRNPLHPYTRLLILSTPSITKRREERVEGIPGLPPNLLSPPEGCRFWPRCPYAFELCKIEEPKTKRMGNSVVACHLY